jgi:predicted RNA-binding Zn-ribbon protein involved in translation (DUF1610 family)
MKPEILSGCHGSGAVTVRWETHKTKLANGEVIQHYGSRLYFFDCPDCKADEIPDCSTCTKRQTRFEKFEQARDAAINQAEHRIASLRSFLRDKKIPARPPKGTTQTWADIVGKLYLSKEAEQWREAIRKVWSPDVPQEKAA